MVDFAKPRSGKRPLSREEVELWRAVTRDVRPLDDRHAENGDTEGREAAGNGSGTEAPTRDGASVPGRTPPRSAAPRAGSAPPGALDRRTLRRIKRGQTPVEAILDLHGHTQAQAHRALNAFLAASQAAGRRCVLVITGKGTRGEGKIRSALPHWLALGDNGGRVIGTAPAQPRDGGEGAIYIYLRKPPKAPARPRLD